VERLGHLVEQLLDLSKLESGAVPLERSEIPARALLIRVADETRPHAEAQHVRVAVSSSPEGLVLDVDVRRMHQVLTNLVANAIRHSPPQTDVRLHASAAEPHRARIEVTDDGPGIPADEVERVFERFYRSDRARSADGGGAGLGLAIARWIVELHGGTIRADPEWGTGCRMVVELPR
jgi:signal transduction histidine kinase